MSVHTRARRSLARIGRRYFSTRDHATSVIADRARLRRYQRQRSVVAVAAGISGGLGVGVSLSHSGEISAQPQVALGIPTLVGLVIALVFIYVRLPDILRWLALFVAAVCFFVWKVDLTIELKLVAGVVGVVVSLLVASVLRLGVEAAIRLARRPSTLLGVALVAAVVAATTDSSHADAAPAPDCARGDVSLVITVDGAPPAVVRDGDRFDLDVPASGTSVTIEAMSSFDHGTVTVELVETAPIPLPGRWVPGVTSDEHIVWVGHLGAAGAARGSTGPVDLEIRKRSGDATYTVVSPAHEVPLRLIAGEGRYRATFTDAETNAACFVDVLVRIEASPAATPVGIAGIAGATLGLFGLAGAISSGRSSRLDRPSRGIPWKPLARRSVADTAGRDRSDAGRSYVTVAACRAVTSNDDGVLWEVTVNVEVNEKEHDVYEIDARPSRLVDLVGFRSVVVFPGADIPQVTIQIRTDPRNVEWRTAVLALEVSSNGVVLTNEELSIFDALSASTDDDGVHETLHATEVVQ